MADVKKPSSKKDRERRLYQFLTESDELIKEIEESGKEATRKMKEIDEDLTAYLKRIGVGRAKCGLYEDEGDEDT